MNTELEDIKHIRSMMERSSKFVSLSGMSGISAGTVALLGAIAGYSIQYHKFSITGTTIYDFFILALAIIGCSAAVGFYFSKRKATKIGSKFWLPVTRQIIKDFSIPMLTGGIFCLILFYQDVAYLIPSVMLIFYGLALIYASEKTYHDVKILGASEIVLGVLAGIFTNNGLLFWSLGFGILHIIYGAIMHFKYDRK